MWNSVRHREGVFTNKTHFQGDYPSAPTQGKPCSADVHDLEAYVSVSLIRREHISASVHSQRSRHCDFFMKGVDLVPLDDLEVCNVIQ